MTTQTVATTTVNGDYDVDAAHSRVGFAAKHAMVTTVRGQFSDFTAELHLDEDSVANSTARIEIRTASLDTGNAQRDEHVRNSDFLDVEQFPTITFVRSGLKWSPTRKRVVVVAADTPGAPYHPYSSGARSVVPFENISNPPRVFMTGTGKVIVWVGSRASNCSIRRSIRWNSPSR